MQSSPDWISVPSEPFVGKNLTIRLDVRRTLPVAIEFVGGSDEFVDSLDLKMVGAEEHWSPIYVDDRRHAVFQRVGLGNHTIVIKTNTGTVVERRRIEVEDVKGELNEVFDLSKR